MFGQQFTNTNKIATVFTVTSDTLRVPIPAELSKAPLTKTGGPTTPLPRGPRRVHLTDRRWKAPDRLRIQVLVDNSTPHDADRKR